MIYLAGVTTLQFFVEKCTGCGRCLEVCPRGVFAKEQNKVRITDKDLCIECGACAQNCAFGALSVEAGVGCAEAIINGMLTGGEASCGCDSSSGGCCG